MNKLTMMSSEEKSIFRASSDIGILLRPAALQPFSSSPQYNKRKSRVNRINRSRSLSNVGNSIKNYEFPPLISTFSDVNYVPNNGNTIVNSGEIIPSKIKSKKG